MVFNYYFDIHNEPQKNAFLHYSMPVLIFVRHCYTIYQLYFVVDHHDLHLVKSRGTYVRPGTRRVSQSQNRYGPAGPQLC